MGASDAAAAGSTVLEATKWAPKLFLNEKVYFALQILN
jgi:hypothetical protein